MAGGGRTRNLVLVHTPERQLLSDWVTIRANVEARAPDIEVRIASNATADHALSSWQVSRPSLVFSAERLAMYRPKGGKVYAGKRFDKIEQTARLLRAGVPTPPTAELTAGLALDRDLFGDYVVVKPVSETRGRGLRLVRTTELAERYSELSKNGQRRMVVQRYVAPADARPAEYRVLTLFGRALVCTFGRWLEPLAPLEEVAGNPDAVVASNAEGSKRERTVASDADVIAAGEQAHRAFPEVGVLGVDVVRDAATGAVFVLECNPVGGTWHFSSAWARAYLSADYLRTLYAQFGALELAAELLVERTRAEAV